MGLSVIANAERKTAARLRSVVPRRGVYDRSGLDRTIEMAAIREKRP